MGRPGQAEGHHDLVVFREADDRGLGAFAAKNIAAGTKVLIDNALFSVDERDGGLDSNEVQAALAKLSQDNMKEPRKRIGLTGWTSESGTFVQTALTILSTSQFPIESLNKSDKTEKAEKSKYCGFFLWAGLFNHSCQPNCRLHENQHGQQECTVMSDVRAGTELTFAYYEQVRYMTRPERQEYMMKAWNFSCACSLCSAPVSETRVTDMRRTLLRYLKFVMSGCNADGQLDEAMAAGYTDVQKSRKMHCMEVLFYVGLVEAEGMTASRPYRASLVYLAEHIINKVRQNLARPLPSRLAMERLRMLMHRAEASRIADPLGEIATNDAEVKEDKKFEAVWALVRGLEKITRLRVSVDHPAWPGGAMNQSGEGQGTPTVCNARIIQVD